MMVSMFFFAYVIIDRIADNASKPVISVKVKGKEKRMDPKKFPP